MLFHRRAWSPNRGLVLPEATPALREPQGPEHRRRFEISLFPRKLFGTGLSWGFSPRMVGRMQANYFKPVINSRLIGGYSSQGRLNLSTFNLYTFNNSSSLSNPCLQPSDSPWSALSPVCRMMTSVWLPLSWNVTSIRLSLENPGLSTT